MNIQQILQSCKKRELIEILQHVKVLEFRPNQSKTQLIEILSSLKDSDILEHVPTNRIRKFLESVNIPSDGTHETLITRLLNKTSCVSKC